MNNVSLIGRLTAKPELKTTTSGKTVTNFTLAVGRGDQTDFIDIVAWNKTAELIVQYMDKGRELGLTGRISVRPYDDKEGNKRKAFEVVANDVTFIGKGDSQSNQPMTQAQALNGGKDVVLQDIDDKPIDLSEIPF